MLGHPSGRRSCAVSHALGGGAAVPAEQLRAPRPSTPARRPCAQRFCGGSRWSRQGGTADAFTHPTARAAPSLLRWPPIPHRREHVGDQSQRRHHRGGDHHGLVAREHAPVALRGLTVTALHEPRSRRGGLRSPDVPCDGASAISRSPSRLPPRSGMAIRPYSWPLVGVEARASCRPLQRAELGVAVAGPSKASRGSRPGGSPRGRSRGVCRTPPTRRGSRRRSWSSLPEEEPRLARGGDGAQRPLRAVVLKTQSPIVEEAPQRLQLRPPNADDTTPRDRALHQLRIDPRRRRRQQGGARARRAGPCDATAAGPRARGRRRELRRCDAALRTP